MPEGPVQSVVQHALEQAHVEEHIIDLSAKDQLDNFCDDTAFARAVKKLKVLIAKPSFTSGLLMNPGSFVPDGIDKTKKK